MMLEFIDQLDGRTKLAMAGILGLILLTQQNRIKEFAATNSALVYMLAGGAIIGIALWLYQNRPQAQKRIDPKEAFTLWLTNTKHGKDFRQRYNIGLRDGERPEVSLAGMEFVLRPDGSGILQGQLFGLNNPRYFAFWFDLTKTSVSDTDTNLLGMKMDVLDVKTETKESDRFLPDITDQRAYQLGKKMLEKTEEEIVEEM